MSKSKSKSKKLQAQNGMNNNGSTNCGGTNCGGSNGMNNDYYGQNSGMRQSYDQTEGYYGQTEKASNARNSRNGGTKS